MKSSKILSAVSLGVFAIVCFIGGFFMGEYATYNANVLKTMIRGAIDENNKNHELHNELVSLGNSTYMLKQLLTVRREENLENSIKILANILRHDVKGWENKFKDKNQNDLYKKLFEIEIRKAKKVLLNAK